MAVPRPVLLALLGMALIASALLAMRSASDPDAAVTAPPPPVEPTPQKAEAAPAKAAPKPASKPAKQAAAPAKAKPVKPAPAKAAKPADSAGKLAPVVKALGRGDAVVLFLTRNGAADDAATRSAVRSAKGMKNVAVFEAGLGDLVTYRSLLSGAGVSQVPAVVIVRSGHKAKLIEGFVDEKTLKQNIADAGR